MKRGRPPPIHEPLRCGGCHEFPQARNGVLNLDRCRCEIEHSPNSKGGVMSVRAKLVVSEIRENRYGSKTVVLEAQYDDTIPEDRRFYDATPTGRCEMMINNPAAIEQLRLGKAFYVDFTPAAE